jgi:hypothetical protein
MVLGEPNQIRADFVQPLHLGHDLVIKILVADTGILGVTKVIANPNP